MTHRLGRLLPAALAASILPAASTAVAQPRLALSGSASLSESYDDNVFVAPGEGQQDMVSRLGASLRLACRAPRFALTARGARDAETFARHPGLNTGRAWQETGLDAGWFPVSGIEVTGSASYVETNTPGELTVVGDLGLTGIELRRSPAHRFATTGSLSWRLGGRTQAVVAHGFTRDDVVGGVSSDTQVASASLRRELGPLDALTFAYELRHFDALGNGSLSQALTVAWARDLTRQTHLEVKAGPRFNAGDVRPELALTLRRRLRRGGASLSFIQTETSLIGRPRPATAQGLTATWTHVFSRAISVAAGPRAFRTTGDALATTAYGTSVDLTWGLGRRLSLVGSHELSVQHDEVDGLQRGEIVHNTVRLRFVAGSLD